MNKINQGILYPKDISITVKKASKPLDMPVVRKVPHKSWDLIVNDLDCVFAELADTPARYIFVMAPLHKGKINETDDFSVFTYDDCFVNHKILEKDSEVCSEEFSFEILLPHIEAYFPNAKCTAFYAPEENKSLKDFYNYLKTEYKNSIFLLSGTEDCCKMWYQAVL